MQHSSKSYRPRRVGEAATSAPLTALLPQTLHIPWSLGDTCCRNAAQALQGLCSPESPKNWKERNRERVRADIDQTAALVEHD